MDDCETLLGKNVDLSVCKSLGFGKRKKIKDVALKADETPLGMMYSSDNTSFRKINSNFGAAS